MIGGGPPVTTARSAASCWLERGARASRRCRGPRRRSGGAAAAHPGGAAVAPLEAAFPDAVRDGAIDRSVLKDIIAADPTALKRIEAIVHPLVAEDRETFKAQATSDIIVLDIPLLFETGGEARMDHLTLHQIQLRVPKLTTRGMLSPQDRRRLQKCLEQ